MAGQAGGRAHGLAARQAGRTSACTVGGRQGKLVNKKAGWGQGRNKEGMGDAEALRTCAPSRQSPMVAAASSAAGGTAGGGQLQRVHTAMSVPSAWHTSWQLCWPCNSGLSVALSRRGRGCRLGRALGAGRGAGAGAARRGVGRSKECYVGWHFARNRALPATEPGNADGAQLPAKLRAEPPTPNAVDGSTRNGLRCLPAAAARGAAAAAAVAAGGGAGAGARGPAAAPAQQGRGDATHLSASEAAAAQHGVAQCC